MHTQFAYMKKLRSLPLVKLALGFMVGIFLAKSIGWSAAGYGLAAFPIYLICLLLNRRMASFRFEILIAVMMYFSTIGAGAVSYLAITYEPGLGLATINCEQVQIVGVVTSSPSTNAYGRKAQVEIAGYMEGDTLRALPGHLLLYIDTAETRSIQKHDSIYATVFITDLYSRYPSYLSYLYSLGITHAAYCKSLAIGRPHITRQFYFDYIQQRLSRQLKMLIPDTETAGIAQAMLLGDKHDLSRETRDAFATAGVSHILAISGLHVGIIYLMLNTLLQVLHLFKNGRRLKYLIMLVLLLIYMMITGGSPAVIRAVVMFGTILVFKIGYQRYHILNVVALSALLQMIWNPEVVFHAGFQLSYSAVTGILILYPLFERSVKTPFPLLNKVYSWIGITLIAQLSTLPLILIHFGQFPTYFLLSNVCLTLLTSAVVLSGFATVMLIAVPGVNLALGYLSYLLLSALLGFCKWIASLPHALITEFAWDEPGLRIVLIQLLAALIFIALPQLPISSWLRPKSPILSYPESV